MPRLLDLFCKAGGASMGYHRAGFDVTGVDIEPQPRYPFRFIQADALAYVAQHGHEYDAIAASPPCQAYTSLSVMPNAGTHPDLVAPTRALLQATGRPYVIENVGGAPLINPSRLCGSSFGLGVVWQGEWRQLRRHRLFETSFFFLAPPCQHQGASIGFYGDHARESRRKPGVRDKGVDITGRQKIPLGHAAMGVPWMDWAEITQAIPPAYTAFIGAQLLRVVTEAKAA